MTVSRDRQAQLGVACLACHAPAGDPCTTPSGRVTRSHLSRMNAWNHEAVHPGHGTDTTCLGRFGYRHCPHAPEHAASAP